MIVITNRRNDDTVEETIFHDYNGKTEQLIPVETLQTFIFSYCPEGINHGTILAHGSGYLHNMHL